MENNREWEKIGNSFIMTFIKLNGNKLTLTISIICRYNAQALQERQLS